MNPAVCVLELSSIAKGIAAGDAMVKRAPLQVLRAGTVHPGKYLVLVGGLTADVEEAMRAGREVAGDALVDLVYLPDVHPDVVASVAGARREGTGEALGVIETTTVAATVDAADAGVKGARVTIRDLRLADDLGGKAYVLFGGEVAEVEAAVGYGVSRAAVLERDVAHVVISQLHDEMRENLAADPRFGHLLGDLEKPTPAEARPVGAVAPRGRPLPGSGGGSRQSDVDVPARPPRSRGSGRPRRSRRKEA
jgi:microcompartment protein CcmL/EutN